MPEPISNYELKRIIQACKNGDRQGQKALYRLFYGYAMGICLRYSPDREEAKEVVNDGFTKIFLQIKQCKKVETFKAWLRKIMIYTAIDQYRSSQKHFNHPDIQHIDVSYQAQLGDERATLDKLSEQEIIHIIQQLSPTYRMVFNLYAIEGYSHKEIAERLGIEVGTSKSNLAKARMKIRKMLNLLDQERFKHYG